MGKGRAVATEIKTKGSNQMPGLKAKMSQDGANEHNSYHTSKLFHHDPLGLCHTSSIKHFSVLVCCQMSFLLLLDTVLVFMLFAQAVHIKMNVCLVCAREFALDKWSGTGIGCFSLGDTDNGCTFKHKSLSIPSRAIVSVLLVWLSGRIVTQKFFNKFG